MDDLLKKVLGLGNNVKTFAQDTANKALNFKINGGPSIREQVAEYQARPQTITNYGKSTFDLLSHAAGSMLPAANNFGRAVGNQQVFSSPVTSVNFQGPKFSQVADFIAGGQDKSLLSNVLHGNIQQIPHTMQVNNAQFKADQALLTKKNLTPDEQQRANDVMTNMLPMGGVKTTIQRRLLQAPEVKQLINAVPKISDELVKKLQAGGLKALAPAEKKLIMSLPVERFRELMNGKPVGFFEKADQQAFKAGTTPEYMKPPTAQELIDKTKATPLTEEQMHNDFLTGPKKPAPSFDIGTPEQQKRLPTVDELLGKQRGFVTSVKEATTVTKKTKALVTGEYLPKKNSQLSNEAQALLQDGASIDFKNTKNLDQKVAATIQDAINLDKSGQHDAAAHLFNNLSEHGTELGRGVQAFSMLDKMSPEAIALSAAGKIKRYNVTAGNKIPELSGDQMKLISDKISAMDGLKGREKNIAINELQQTLNEFIPSTLADKAITVWKAGLLTSLRTHERNLLGNTIQAGAEIAKDPFASVADMIMAAKTGKRSLTTTLQGTIAGGKKGAIAAKDIVQRGYDPEEAIAKHDIKTITWGKNPTEQFLKHATDTVFRTLGGEDKIFWHSSYARSLYDQAGAAAINAGKQGNGKFIEKLVKNPTEEMLKTALVDANYATFHDKNMFSAVAGAIKRAAQDPKWGKKAEVGKVITEVMAPFVSVPSSIAGKTIAYSPIGLVKGAVKVGRVLAGQVPELQRQAAQEVGRGVVGTGLYGLGAYLMSQGLMTGQPKDTAEADLWAAEGKQANSILIGGKWRSINSVGPQNLVMLAGAKLQEELGKPDGSLGTYAAALGKDQLSQTFLAGVQQPLNAITDPARYGKSTVGNEAASIIPNIVKDTAKAFDPSQRENNTILDYFTNAVPGLRNQNITKRDVFGNVMPQEPTGASAFFDLFNSKTPIDNVVVQELTRLFDTGNEAVPSKLKNTQTINREKIKLTFQQLDSLEANVGEALKPQLESLVQSGAYQGLADDEKANAINNLVTKVRKQVKSQLDLSGTPGNKTYTQSADAPTDLFGKAALYGTGLLTDPGSTAHAFLSGQPLRKISNDAVILERQQNLNTAHDGMILDHVVPLSLGGDNSSDNLAYQDPQQAAAKDVLEKKLAKQLAAKQITKFQAQQQMKEFVQQATPASGTTTGSKTFAYTDAQGTYKTIDTAKIAAMPEGTRYEKTLKEKAAYKLVDDILTNLPEQEQAGALAAVGIDKEWAAYYNVARQPDDAKYAYIQDQMDSLGNDRHKFLAMLAHGRASINNKQLVSNGVVDDLYKNGLITSAERTQLKKITIDSQGKQTTKLSTGGSGPKAKKLPASIATAIKKGPKLASTSQLIAATKKQKTSPIKVVKSTVTPTLSTKTAVPVAPVPVTQLIAATKAKPAKNLATAQELINKLKGTSAAAPKGAPKLSSSFFRVARA